MIERWTVEITMPDGPVDVRSYTTETGARSRVTSRPADARHVQITEHHAPIVDVRPERER